MGRVRTRKQAAANSARWHRDELRRMTEHAPAEAMAWSREVLRRVEALGPDPDPDELSRAYGCRSPFGDCRQCGAEPEAVVRVGRACGRENRTADLCLKCVTLACLSLVLHDLPAGKAADAGEMPAAVLADYLENNAAEVVQRLAAALRGGAG